MMDNPGYHLREIQKGRLGEISKIQEEVDELLDAQAQGSKVMELFGDPQEKSWAGSKP